MKTKRFWIEIVALGSAIACGLALLMASLGAGAVALRARAASGQATNSSSSSSPAAASSPVPSSPAAPEQTRDGMVTDSRCGAKHSADIGKTAAECARDCVHEGATFSLVDGDRTYQLEGDADLLKRAAGRRARIQGVVRGNTIKVSSVSAAS